MSKKISRCFAVAFFLIAAPALAQDARGTIVGRVIDSSGAVMPTAEVRAVNVATGVAVSAKTNESGNFSLPYLVPGLYNVTTESAGFKKSVRDNVQVRVGETVQLSIEMAIGDIA